VMTAVGLRIPVQQVGGSEVLKEVFALDVAISSETTRLMLYLQQTTFYKI
jgi:hypothetical protein